MEPALRPTLLRWQLHPAGARLFHQERCVLDIVHQPDGSRQFVLSERTYTLRNVGFWAPRTEIALADTVVLYVEHRGFFKSDQVVLSSGPRYTVAWTNTPLAKLALRDAAGVEVLSLRLATEGGVHTETVLAAGQPLDGTALLLLAFAYERFGAVIREQGGDGDLLLLVS
ncbi:MAG: hypothetical protein R2817_07865 [Flavobacteriales bacterium]